MGTCLIFCSQEMTRHRDPKELLSEVAVQLFLLKLFEDFSLNRIEHNGRQTLMAFVYGVGYTILWSSKQAKQMVI